MEVAGTQGMAGAECRETFLLLKASDGRGRPAAALTIGSETCTFLADGTLYA